MTDKMTPEQAIAGINEHECNDVCRKDYWECDCDGCRYMMAIEALEKQIPKKPNWDTKGGFIHTDFADGSSETKYNKYEDWFCPTCGWIVGERYNHPHFKKGYHNQRKSKFCNECGQAIDWESDKECHT